MNWSGLSLIIDEFDWYTNVDTVTIDELIKRHLWATGRSCHSRLRSRT